MEMDRILKIARNLAGIKSGESAVPASSQYDINSVKFLDEDGPVLRLVCVLEKLKNINIIVNSTDRSLNLAFGGGISKAILRLAGPQIQRTLNENYPDGIDPGEIAVTDGFGLQFNYVYHCSLQNIQRRISHHEIREVITKCLETAVEMFKPRKPRIAFPAIGTGGMNFPPRILKTIYCTILEFIVNNPGTVELAVVFIHPGRPELIKTANDINKRKETERLNYQVNIPWGEENKIRRVPLSQQDSDYIHVRMCFMTTINRNVHIIKIERIQNKRLYVAFERYKNSFPSDQRTPENLWHGTAHTSIDGITRYGFDWRLTARAAFGQGCYFAKEARYSDQDTYSKPSGNGEKCMFLAYVLVGKYIQGDSNFTEANICSNVQTTVNNVQNPTIFVTYDDDQVYPAFLVVYK